MNQNPVHYGMDVAQATLERAGPAQARTFSNDGRGHATLVRWLAGTSAHVVSVLNPRTARNRDSGQWRGKRTIGGGRTQVRQSLYMAAVTASKHNPILRVFYQRLIRSKPANPSKLSLTAVMRKLVELANHLLQIQNFILAS